MNNFESQFEVIPHALRELMVCVGPIPAGNLPNMIKYLV